MDLARHTRRFRSEPPPPNRSSSGGDPCGVVGAGVLNTTPSVLGWQPLERLRPPDTRLAVSPPLTRSMSGDKPCGGVGAQRFGYDSNRWVPAAGRRSIGARYVYVPGRPSAADARQVRLCPCPTCAPGKCGPCWARREAREDSSRVGGRGREGPRMTRRGASPDRHGITQTLSGRSSALGNAEMSTSGPINVRG